MAHTAAVKPKKPAASRPAAKRARTKAPRRAPAEPTASEIEARKSVARTFFDPAAAAAARGAFLKRQRGGSANGKANGSSAPGGTAHAR